MSNVGGHSPPYGVIDMTWRMVGWAVPTDSRRHGVRPCDGTQPMFLFRLDRPFFWSAAGLIPETYMVLTPETIFLLFIPQTF
jgi:hypothetical protein